MKTSTFARLALGIWVSLVLASCASNGDDVTGTLQCPGGLRIEVMDRHGTKGLGHGTMHRVWLRAITKGQKEPIYLDYGRVQFPYTRPAATDPRTLDGPAPIYDHANILNNSVRTFAQVYVPEGDLGRPLSRAIIDCMVARGSDFRTILQEHPAHQTLNRRKTVHKFPTIIYWPRRRVSPVFNDDKGRRLVASTNNLLLAPEPIEAPKAPPRRMPSRTKLPPHKRTKTIGWARLAPTKTEFKINPAHIEPDLDLSTFKDAQGRTPLEFFQVKPGDVSVYKSRGAKPASPAEPAPDTSAKPK